MDKVTGIDYILAVSISEARRLKFAFKSCRLTDPADSVKIDHDR